MPFSKFFAQQGRFATYRQSVFGSASQGEGVGEHVVSGQLHVAISTSTVTLHGHLKTAHRTVQVPGERRPQRRPVLDMNGQSGVAQLTGRHRQFVQPLLGLVVIALQKRDPDRYPQTFGAHRRAFSVGGQHRLYPHPALGQTTSGQPVIAQ